LEPTRQILGKYEIKIFFFRKTKISIYGKSGGLNELLITPA
jgi:hypothetical protein